MTDIINVTDYGADVSGGSDSSTAIQRALDAAFGSSSSPNGLSGSYNNRQVFFPNGKYIVRTPLNLTLVVGGYIFGAGSGATIIQNDVGGNVFNINGAANLVMERMSILGSTTTSGIGIDLNWNNSSGGDGLHSNVFRDLSIQTLNTGVRIAQGGNGGADNLFQNCTFHVVVTGIDAQSATAINNVAISGGGADIRSNGQLYWSSAGSIHTFEASIGNSSGTINAIRVDADLPVCVVGGRIESCNTYVKATAGLITLRACYMAGGTELLNLASGKASVEGCLVFNSGLGQINGTTGTLYLRGNSGLNISGFSGTLAQNI